MHNRGSGMALAARTFDLKLDPDILNSALLGARNTRKQFRHEGLEINKSV